MIPRFIVRNTNDSMLKLLKDIGYTCNEDPVPKDILIIGSSVLKAPPAAKNPLVVNMVADDNNWADILNQAIVHRDWEKQVAKGNFADVKVGKEHSVRVTKLGVLVDSFVVPMSSFVRMANSMISSIGLLPMIATHEPVQKNDKMTIGCADYSMKDFDAIKKAYDKFLISNT